MTFVWGRLVWTTLARSELELKNQFIPYARSHSSSWVVVAKGSLRIVTKSYGILRVGSRQPTPCTHNLVVSRIEMVGSRLPSPKLLVMDGDCSSR
jgi:hypothetical protein